jgi:MFS family permease
MSTARRWSMLAIALFATLFSNVFINGVAFLIPSLHTEFGLDLAGAGLISAMPKFGMVPTLIAWGYVVDRAGERFVLWVGSALTAAAALAAALSDSLAAGWWWAGFPPSGAVWPWASGRRPSHWGWGWARW